MNRQKLEQIKLKLFEDKTRLEKELSRFATKDKIVKDDFDTRFPEFGRNEEDNAQEVTSYTDNLSIEHSLELKLKDVNDALEKIKKGTYGTCEKCSQKIKDARLEILPTARLCMDCYKKGGSKQK